MICSNSQMVLNKTLIKQKQMAFNKVSYKHAHKSHQKHFSGLSISGEIIRQDIKGNHPLTCDLRKCLGSCIYYE